MAPSSASTIGISPTANFSRRGLPAWIMSTVLHCILLTLLGFLLQVVPKGAAVEPNRDGGIVLVQQKNNATEYFSEADAAANSSSENFSQTARQDGKIDLPNDGVAASTGQGLIQLPDVGDLVGGSGGEVSAPDVGALTQGKGPSRNIDGSTQTGVFGVAGKGSKFVYVFDRSGSMQGFQGRPLNAAKRELISSLTSLDSVNQFQIIFYNERAFVFNPMHPQPARLLFGDDSNKRLAGEFINGIIADGATRHMPALRLALNMSPDVIFFLTDAAQPTLTEPEMMQLRRINRSDAVIHTIEFGTGPFPGGANFLTRLAEQHRGQHVYVDISQLPRS
ncbi:MAG: hypothetical protein ACI9G1_000206 [Pirellulaceae bacterium]|jgi:hypothetical protein